MQSAETCGGSGFAFGVRVACASSEFMLVVGRSVLAVSTGHSTSAQSTVQHSMAPPLLQQETPRRTPVQRGGGSGGRQLAKTRARIHDGGGGVGRCGACSWVVGPRGSSSRAARCARASDRRRRLVRERTARDCGGRACHAGVCARPSWAAQRRISCVEKSVMVKTACRSTEEFFGGAPADSRGGYWPPARWGGLPAGTTRTSGGAVA